MNGVQKGLFTPLGQGDVPIAQIIVALENAGYNGWYVIEQDTAITGAVPANGQGPVESVSQSINYLKDVVVPMLAKA
jgi:inosose dehydratase